MRIATYDLCKGGARRTHLAKLLNEHHVDLLLAQECAEPSEHLSPLFYPDLGESIHWQAVERNGWGSAIVSPKRRLKPLVVPGFEGWVVGAELEGLTGNAPLLVCSLYAPTGSGTYIKVVNQILDTLLPIAAGREVVLGGDFNLTVSGRVDPSRPPRSGELQIQQRLREQFGLINCWDTANPTALLPQTLRWSRDPSAIFHCDGLFVPRSWAHRVESCAVLSSPEWQSLSDHHPVVAEICE